MSVRIKYYNKTEVISFEMSQLSNLPSYQKS